MLRHKRAEAKKRTAVSTSETMPGLSTVMTNRAVLRTLQRRAAGQVRHPEGKARRLLCYIGQGLLALILLTAPSHLLAAEQFDISYLWHQDPGAVIDYRGKVIEVLGPAIAARLKVVRSGKLTGLVFVRKGEHRKTVNVAAIHSRLLRAGGLERAAAVAAKDWNMVRALPAVHMTQARATPAKVAKRMMRHRWAVEQAVESHIKKLRAKGRIDRDERTAWSVYDFTSSRKLVTINEELQLQSASLVKPFIAAAFLTKMKRDALKYQRRGRIRMERMIQRSDNAATNWATRKLGGPSQVERFLKRRYPGIFQDTRIVEYIPRNGRTYRNKASAHDLSRFLYALWNNRFDGADELKRLMALPGPDRIKSRAKLLPSSTRIYNKTGSTARLCADMGIVLVTDDAGNEYPYTFIGIIEKASRATNYTRWIRARSNVIGEVSDIVYSRIAKRYGISTG